MEISDYYILEYICRFLTNYDIFNLILTSKQYLPAIKYLDPSAENNKALFWTIKNKKPILFKKLFAVPKIFTTCDKNHLFRLACEANATEVAQQLLDYPDFTLLCKHFIKFLEFDESDECCNLYHVIKNNNIELFKIILKKINIDRLYVPKHILQLIFVTNHKFIECLLENEQFSIAFNCEQLIFDYLIENSTIHSLELFLNKLISKVKEIKIKGLDELIEYDDNIFNILMTYSKCIINMSDIFILSVRNNSEKIFRAAIENNIFENHPECLNKAIATAKKSHNDKYELILKKHLINIVSKKNIDLSVFW